MKKSLIEKVRESGTKKTMTITEPKTELELTKSAIVRQMKRANAKLDECFIYLHMPSEDILNWLRDENFAVVKSGINGSEKAYQICW